MKHGWVRVRGSKFAHFIPDLDGAPRTTACGRRRGSNLLPDLPPFARPRIDKCAYCMMIAASWAQSGHLEGAPKT